MQVIVSAATGEARMVIEVKRRDAMVAEMIQRESRGFEVGAMTQRQKYAGICGGVRERGGAALLSASDGSPLLLPRKAVAGFQGSVPT